MKTSNLEIYIQKVNPSKKFNYVRYQGYFYIYVNGKRKKIKGTIMDSEQKAKRKAREKRNSYLENNRVITSKMTIEDLFNEWIELVSPNYAYSTIEGFTGTFNKYFKNNSFPINNVKLSDISHHDLQEFVKKIYELTKDTKSRRYASIYKLLKLLLEYAYTKEYIPENYSYKIIFQIPKNRTRKSKEPLPPISAFLDFIDYLEDTTLKTIGFQYSFNVCVRYLELIRVTGYRVSEPAGISWNDLNPTRSSIYLHNRVSLRKGGERVLAETKTEATSRETFIPKETMKILLEWKLIQSDFFKRMHKENKYNMIFTSKEGDLFNYRNINRRMQIYRDITGIRLYPHQLRHIKATLLKNNLNTETKEIAELLGHSSQETTEFYIHEDERKIKELNDQYIKLIPSLMK